MRGSAEEEGVEAYGCKRGVMDSGSLNFISSQFDGCGDGPMTYVYSRD